MSEPGEVWGNIDDSDDDTIQDLQPEDGILILENPEMMEMYKVDPEKLKTVEDVVRIIDALDIRISPVYQNFDKIKDLLTKEDDDGGVGR